MRDWLAHPDPAGAVRVWTRTAAGAPRLLGCFPDPAAALAWIRSQGGERLTWQPDPQVAAAPPPVWYLSQGLGPLLGLWQPPLADPVWWADADGRPARLADPAAAAAAVRQVGGRVAAWTPQAVLAARAEPDPGGAMSRVWHPWPQSGGWQVWQVDPAGRIRVARQPGGAPATWRRWGDLAQWAATTGQRLRWFAPAPVLHARLRIGAAPAAPRLAPPSAS